jgi:RNA polymerase sigma factor (sigma-70 family)
MPDSTWKTLRAMLVERYDELSMSLSRHLGSKDLAEEALQDTFLRLARGGDVAPVRNPASYLYRTAFNLAISRTRSERRRLTVIEANSVLDAIDDQPTPAQVMEARSDLRVVQQTLAEMPPRRRAIFEAAWIEDVPHKEIAARHRLSLRMVQIELKHAADHVAERLAKSNIADFAPSPRKTSVL